MPPIVGLLGSGAFRLCFASGVARSPGYGSLLTFRDSVLGSESVRDITAALRSPYGLFVGFSLCPGRGHCLLSV